MLWLYLWLWKLRKLLGFGDKMFKMFVLLVVLVGLFVVVCGVVFEIEEYVGMEYGNMYYVEVGDMAVLQLLVDDGVMLVIDVCVVWMCLYLGGCDVIVVYFIICLSEGLVDCLFSVCIDGVEWVELYGYMMSVDGLMQMWLIGFQDVNNEGLLVFMFGGCYLMVFGFVMVVEGEEVIGMLVFECVGEVFVIFVVCNMLLGMLSEYQLCCVGWVWGFSFVELVFGLVFFWVIGLWFVWLEYVYQFVVYQGDWDQEQVIGVFLYQEEYYKKDCVYQCDQFI